MKTPRQYIVQVFMLALMLSGCYLTREPVRYRDEYFRPLTTIPQRNQAKHSSTDLDHLKNRIESTAREVGVLKDSLSLLQKYSGSLLVSTRTLLDKVSALETKDYLTAAKQKDIDKNLLDLQSENKQLSHQLEELNTRLLTQKANPESSVFSPVRMYSFFRSEYVEGLLLFHQRQYEKAIDTFNGLKEKGIEEDLADNCEYWIGECRYARREYREAINAFQKVISLEVSNKKIDAYFMMGKSYEIVGDPAKARWAYEELNAHYPDNEHIQIVIARLNVLQQGLAAPKNTKHKKTSI